jgi:F0F1-type ATP synthase assembly protein I
MEPISKKRSNKGQKLPVFEVIVEIYAWLEIVFASVLVGIIIGLVVYQTKPGKTGLALGIAITIVGLVVGIILAINSSKNRRATQVDSGSTEDLAFESKK